MTESVCTYGNTNTRSYAFGNRGPCGHKCTLYPNIGDPFEESWNYDCGRPTAPTGLSVSTGYHNVINHLRGGGCCDPVIDSKHNIHVIHDWMVDCPANGLCVYA